MFEYYELNRFRQHFYLGADNGNRYAKTSNIFKKKKPNANMDRL